MLHVIEVPPQVSQTMINRMVAYCVHFQLFTLVRLSQNLLKVFKVEFFSVLNYVLNVLHQENV